MIAVVLKGIAGRKLRALLTAFAIVIGVAMVAGTFILTDTTEKSGLALDDASIATTDAVIFQKVTVKDSQTGSGATVPASLLTQVRALPEVAAAAGDVMPQDSRNVADIIGRDGQAAASQSFGRGFDPATAAVAPVQAGAFGPLELKSGHWAKGPHQVVIDRHTALTQRYAIGDRVVIEIHGKRHSFEIAGTTGWVADQLPPRPSVAAWDLKTSQALLDRAGRFDTISIQLKKGHTTAELAGDVKPLLPADLGLASTATSTKAAEADWSHTMGSVRAFLLVFAGIALLVGAFVIFNALSITVAQRTRELATLRTLGASRRQVMRSVVLEGLVLGLVASVIGIVVGLGLAKGMLALFDALGVELPKGSTVLASRTIVVSLLVGTGITLLASILPARRATRVPPIAAVREGATLPPTKLAEQSHNAGVAVTVASLAAIAVGLFAGGVSPFAAGLLLGGGVLALFAGIALLAPRLVKPLAQVVGWPARRSGAAGELAVANAVRHPGRTASTAATLMIGLTLVTVVAVLGSGLRASTERGVSDQLTAGYVIDGTDGQSFDAAHGEKLAAVAGVRTASHVRTDNAIVQGAEKAVSAVDPASIAQVYSFTWTAGSEGALARLGSDGALLTNGYAHRAHLRVGSHVAVKTPKGDRLTLTVRGIYDAPGEDSLLGDVAMDQTAFDRAFTKPRNSLTLLDADAGAARAIETAAAGLGDVKFHTAAGYVKDAGKDMQTLLAMLYALLGFSVIVSLFGMVNTLVLSVFERTRELGMLRTIGMTRRQARRMIRHESVITALIGAALGLGLGVFLAALAIVKGDLPIAIPVQTLAAFTVASVLLGIAAAVMPARRASRLNVLDALSYE